MPATAEQIAELRLMVAEPTEDPYTDEALAVYIEKYPVFDERGEVPYTWDTSTSPPTKLDNDIWIPNYDLHAAAADVWGNKAAALQNDFDFRSDDQSFDRSQKYRQAMGQMRYHKSCRRPTSTTVHKYPKEAASAQSHVINQPERDDI